VPVEFDELQRQFGNLRDGQIGVLRVGIGEDIAAGLPLMAISDLEAEMRGISVVMSSGNEIGRLRNRDIDLAVVTNPQTDQSVEVLASQTVPLTVRATRDWAAPEGQVRLWELVERRLVLPPEGTGSRAVISHKLRRHALEEGRTSSVPASFLRQAMASGPRACVFARTVFSDPTEWDDLRRISMNIGTVQISVLRLAGLPLTRQSQCFLRHVQSRVNAESL
jgi:hypothetical protein